MNSYPSLSKTSSITPIPNSILSKTKHTHHTESRKWYRWTYLQGRNRGTDIENALVDTGREGESGNELRE